MNITRLKKFEAKDIVPYVGSFRDVPHLVVDTETVQGKPYTVQFYTGGHDVDLFYVTADNITDLFYDYLELYVKPDMVVWCFYAPFDIPIVYYRFKDFFLHESSEFWVGKHQHEFVSGKTWFANCRYQKHNWYWRDAFQYCFLGLEKVAKDLQLEHGKLPRPDYIGEREPTREEKPYFERYAKQDVLVLWKVVQWIVSIHRRYDVGLSVSLADLCGKIFRKSYFQVGQTIKLPATDISLAALQSYHGGKTECYVSTPCMMQDVYEYDIKSAYPWAMVTGPNWFDYGIYQQRRPTLTDVRETALYQVSGYVDCPYRGLYTHDFKPEKKLDETWVTGFELAGVVARKEFEGVIHAGYIIESSPDSHNPIQSYVWDFFRKKEQADTEGNKTERLWSKLALNALYGKFIARVISDDDALGYCDHWRGGVLFNPIVATCVTGKLRGYVHDIEHALRVFHTSTDSFVTQEANATALFEGLDSLGSLRKERFGDCLILRRKLYIFFEGTNRDCQHDWQFPEGVKHKTDVICSKCAGLVRKVALHGFFGNTKQLLQMYERKQTTYVVKRMTRLRECYISRDPEMIPFLVRPKQRTLHIDWSAFHIGGHMHEERD